MTNETSFPVTRFYGSAGFVGTAQMQRDGTIEVTTPANARHSKRPALHRRKFSKWAQAEQFFSVHYGATEGA
jgi:hypothetical protein